MNIIILYFFINFVFLFLFTLFFKHLMYLFFYFFYKLSEFLMYVLFLILLNINSVFNELSFILMLNMLHSFFYNTCKIFFQFHFFITYVRFFLKMFIFFS